MSEFAQIASEVALGSSTSTLPYDLRQHLMRVNAVNQNQSDDLMRFVTTARSIQDRLFESASASRTKAIEDLAEFVKRPLLATLNSIVDAISPALKQVVSIQHSETGRQTETIHSAISVLEKISRMIIIISVNASIEASRVGEAGRGFSAVAGEIRSLSQSANKVIGSLRTQYASSGSDNLNGA